MEWNSIDKVSKQTELENLRIQLEDLRAGIRVAQDNLNTLRQQYPETKRRYYEALKAGYGEFKRPCPTVATHGFISETDHEANS